MPSSNQWVFKKTDFISVSFAPEDRLTKSLDLPELSVEWNIDSAETLKRCLVRGWDVRFHTIIFDATPCAHRLDTALCLFFSTRTFILLSSIYYPAGQDFPGHARYPNDVWSLDAHAVTCVLQTCQTPTLFWNLVCVCVKGFPRACPYRIACSWILKACQSPDTTLSLVCS